jgi:hypothetical protein
MCASRSGTWSSCSLAAQQFCQPPTKYKRIRCTQIIISPHSARCVADASCDGALHSVHSCLLRRPAHDGQGLGIAVCGWSPLGLGGALGDPAVLAAAARHGRSPAAVALRWLWQVRRTR